MPILNKEDKKELEMYNNFVRNYPGANLMQDINWSKVKKEWNNEIVYISENGNIIASLSILLQKVPKINSYLAYCPRGPVCDISNIELVENLLKEAEELRKKYNIFVIKMDPEVLQNEEISNLYKNHGFRVSGEEVSVDELIQPIHNMILKLDGEDEESLFKRFSEKTRYNIRLSNKKGVKVRYSTLEEDLKVFYDIYKITCKRDKIGCRAYSYFKDMLDAYKGYLRIYVASHEGDDLSAAICINYGGKAFYIYGASSNEKRNLMPNYAMQWEMIKWALETKCTNYDFGGVLNLDSNNGLFRFKSGFCKKEGVTVLIGEIDKVYDKKVYFAYSKVFPKVKRVRKFFRNIKRNITSKK